MALKVTVASLDDVQEGLREYYAEADDGSFVLQVEGVDSHPEVRNLKTAYTAEKTKRAEKDAALRDALAKLEAKPAPTVKDEAEMVRLREELEGKVTAAEARAAELEKRVYGLTVETQLDGLIREIGITQPAYAKAAKVLLSAGVKLVNDSPVVETDMGPVPLGEHVKRWAAGEGKAFVDPGKGGGASGNSGGKTGGKTIAASELETMSPTEKAAYFKANPGVTVEG